MAVRIRLKKMGRKARPFFRLCAVDSRAPRDGKVIEELGFYDPMIRDTDARVKFKRERIDYWLGVGAQPTHKAGVLIRKYGTEGTHLEKHEAAVAALEASRNARAIAARGVAAPTAEAETAADAPEGAATAEAPTEG